MSDKKHGNLQFLITVEIKLASFPISSVFPMSDHGKTEAIFGSVKRNRVKFWCVYDFGFKGNPDSHINGKNQSIRYEGNYVWY